MYFLRRLFNFAYKLALIIIAFVILGDYWYIALTVILMIIILAKLIF